MEKNRKKQSKALNQAASGTRINYAGDDASGYAISERMRVQIRSLNQDVENVKTGKDLLHTAEGGVQSIVNELRNLKAMALDSANDTKLRQRLIIMGRFFLMAGMGIQILTQMIAAVQLY